MDNNSIISLSSLDWFDIHVKAYHFDHPKIEYLKIYKIL